jgi:hypothetical protein
VATVTGPCAAWDPIWCCATSLPTGSAAVTGQAVQAATEVLWQASGQRFGLCQVTVRPCRRDCYGQSWPYTSYAAYEWTGQVWPQPVLSAGAWTNVTCGSCPGTCSCTQLEQAVLPAPVYDIVEVRVDGSPLVTGSYRLDNDRTLVRTDGGRWPGCQDLSKADTEPDTWSVTARFGEDVPTLGRQAVGELACEMVRACLGEDCRLPAHVTQLVRQGVTISFPDAQELAERGYFGGLFIQTYNPRRLAGRAQVYDVDGPGFRRTGT